MQPIARALASATLIFLGLASAPAKAQTVLWSDDFENGSSQWTTTGFWHEVDASNACLPPALPFPSGTHAMWYGIDGQCNYDNGLPNGGNLISLTSVFLPQNGQVPVLRYRHLRQTEQCVVFFFYDTTTVSVSSGASTLQATECQSGVWRKGRLDLASLAGSSVTVRFQFQTQDGDLNGTLGAFVDDVVIQLEPGASYCEGQTAQACPCPQSSGGVEFQHMSRVAGCKHSQSAMTGAELYGGGTPSVASDDVVLHAVDLPATTNLTFIQGDVGVSPTPFGDGGLCLTGSLKRLVTRPGVGGSVSYPGPGDPPLSLLGSIPPGGATVAYQASYRDNNPTFCTAATYNATNAYRVVWIP